MSKVICYFQCLKILKSGGVDSFVIKDWWSSFSILNCNVSHGSAKCSELCKKSQEILYLFCR